MAQRTAPPTLAVIDTLPDLALIDVRVLALLLGCSENTVWRRARAGLLPAAIRVSPQQTRWRLGEVRKALASLGNSPEVAA